MSITHRRQTKQGGFTGEQRLDSNLCGVDANLEAHPTTKAYVDGRKTVVGFVTRENTTRAASRGAPTKRWRRNPRTSALYEVLTHLACTEIGILAAYEKQKEGLWQSAQNVHGS